MITPERGKNYIVKHSSGMIRACFITERIYKPISRNRRSITRYLFQSLESGRDIVIKSRVKIRSEVTA